MDDEDEYAITVVIEQPDHAKVAVRLSWQEEPDWNAVIAKTPGLAVQALGISTNMSGGSDA